MNPINQFRFNCDRLWKLWYSLILILIQIMLIGFGISNYIEFKSQSINPRFGGQWSKIPANLQLFAIIFSISFFLLFVYSCIFKVGNIANDGIELGIDHNSIDSAFKSMMLNKGVGLFLLRLKTHLLPYNCLIHVIIALLLALPRPLMQAEQIKNEAISSEFLWLTDINFLITQPSSNIHKKTPISTISPESLNLLLSLLILTVRISSPFWYTNKAFSIIFSLFTFVSSFSIFVEYELLVPFVKVVYNGESEFVNVKITIVLSFFTSILILLMLIIIFEYGYAQFMTNMRNYRQYFSSDISDSVSQQSQNNHQIRFYQVAPRLLGGIVLTFVIIAKAYSLHTFMEFYFKMPDSSYIVLLNLTVSVFYFICSIFLWFGLCIKTKWQFHVNIQRNPIAGMNPGKLAGSPEPVYGCFENATSGSSQTSLMRPMLRSSIDGSESSSYRCQSGNYVMMQMGAYAMPIREASEKNIDDSEASYDSQGRFTDPNDHRYRPYMFQTHQIDNAQYATIPSLHPGMFLTSKTLSDSSSNDTAPFGQSRRVSSRVTFKEQPNTIDVNRYQSELGDTRNYQGSTPEVPDILSMNCDNRDRSASMYPESNSPHGFDPSLEMSTDMRKADNSDCKTRDPRLCSQV